MNVTFRQLRLFQALADTGSVSAAARVMHVTQPTASMQLKEVSQAVGLPLYEVLGRKVYLTDAGRELAAAARAMTGIWESFEQSVDAVKGLARGRLRVAVVSTAKYFIPRLIGSFCRKHPAIDVALEILNRGQRVWLVTATPVELASMCQQLFEFFDVIADEKNVQLQYEGPALTINADKLMLQRALSNLLSNAIRHAAAHSTVRIKVTSGITQVDIRVINQGLVIAAEHLPRLFERFYRADPSRQRHSEGAGLGLAMVKSIVELHGAQINASSVLKNSQEPNQAQTEFVLHWPQ